MQGQLRQPPVSAFLPGATLPGPRGWPVVGDLSALGATRDPLEHYESYWRRYGDSFRVPMLGTATVVLAHPEAIKHVLSTHSQNYVKGSVYAGARRIMGDSLLTLEGDAWRARRRLQPAAFQHDHIEQLTGQVVACGATFFDSLAQRGRAGTVEIDAHREMVRLTLDIVVRALFGRVGQAGPISYELLTEALQFVGEGVNQMVLPAWLPTAHNRRLRSTLQLLDRSMYALMDTARASNEPDCLLSQLLAARDDQGQPLPLAVIRDELMTMFIAGHETTALTLTWLFTLLYGQRAVLERMHAEVDLTLGERDPTYADLPKLRYLRQVVDETLRLRPPIPLLARNVLADDTIAGYRVRAGELVLPFVWAAQRHPAFWADPLQFNPNRFAPEHDHERHAYCYVPFSAGTRACIGSTFARTETVLLLAQLLRRFEIEVPPCADVRPVALVTARPSRPIRVILRGRSGRRAVRVR